MRRLRRLLLLVALAAGATAGWGAQPRSLDDILQVLDSRPVDRAGLERARGVLAAPLPAADDAALAKAHWERSRAAGELGLVGPQIEELRRVVALGGGPELQRAWRELGQAEFFGGNFRNAVAAREKAFSLIPGNMRGRMLSEHTGLADLYRRLGDFAAARRHVREAEGLLVLLRRTKNWDDYQYNWQAQIEDALGRTEFSAGHYAEAEARFQKALDYLDKDLAENARRLAAGRDSPPQYLLENWRDGLEGWLAQALLRQGRLHEADFHARQGAWSAVQRGGQDGIRANIALQQLALVLGERSQPAPALQLAERIQANLERLGLPPTAYFLARNRSLKANLLAGLGRWPEALAEYEAMRAALAADPQLADTLGAPSLGWVRTLLASGRPAQALADAEKLYRQWLGQLGAAAYETAEAQGFVGAALAAGGRRDEALQALRAALAVLLPAAAEQNDRSGRRFQRLAFIIESYLKVLAAVRGTPAEKAAGLDAAAEAFLVADTLRGQAVQQAMAASALRAAAGTPELAALVREEQDARQERDALYAILADLMSRPADQLLPGVVEQMRQRTMALDGRQKELAAAIRQRFPDYADLAAARPVPLTEVQKALRPGEALLSVHAGEEQTYVWAVPARGKAVFAAVALPRGEVEARVARLRAALDPGDVDYRQIPAFDGDLAHRLFQDLLAPVAAGWTEATHLIVAAGGSLGRLPFAVLPTAPPPPAPAGAAKPLLFAEYRDWPWLARRLAVSQLPAAASLVTLRRMQAGSGERHPFVGFGDPQFRLAAAGAAGRSRALRAVVLPGGRRAESVDYGRIAPLPDTREEILSLAQALHADPRRDVHLGAEASRDKVMALDLRRHKVVAFATHGLLAGEYPGIDQPALALANPGNGGHGLLTLDDILGLKLDADWVVLSACNTAGGEGQGAEAISGLGRGFFYAGSRALLVTHWPVESVSAKQLVVGVFAALAAGRAGTRAVALQQAMLQVMTGQGEDAGLRFSYAHPLFWAPYALVGDGGN